MNGFSPVRIVLLGSAMLMEVSGQRELRSAICSTHRSTARTGSRSVGRAKRGARARRNKNQEWRVAGTLSLCPPYALISRRDSPMHRVLVTAIEPASNKKIGLGSADTGA